MPPKRRYTDEKLIEAVKESSNMSEVLRRLGLNQSGSQYALVRSHFERLGIDDDHFVLRHRSGRRITDEDWIAKNLIDGIAINGGVLKGRLYSSGSKIAQCERCGITEWQGEPAPLQIEHINGDHFDNRIENLSILCGNCHCLTPTYGNKKRGRALPTRTCLDCSTSVTRSSLRCNQCSPKGRHNKTKIDWPDSATLRVGVKESGYAAVSRSLGVSDKAVRKHLDKHP